MLEDLERRLRDHLTILMALEAVAEAEQVRREVIRLSDQVRTLDSNVPEQWAVRELYGYVDWRSRDALSREIHWLSEEQSAIDRALLSILDQSRSGQTADEIRRARAGLDDLRARIGQLEVGADRAYALRCLTDYVDKRSSWAMERADLTEREREHEPLKPSALYREERERPMIEWER
ncbi:hypothetical protein [Nocardia sp. NPDC004860]|uniref:hypothetical protein n=1 Tax=Nocardia sp. NPDC004860 TaxID=3154557 RepID=UPI0033A8EF2E